MLNREKHANFFPEKVYRCPCLLQVIDQCFENDDNSFVEIHDEVVSFVLENGLPKVYAIKCGENLKDCIFCCEKHVSIMVFAKKKIDCTAEISFETLTINYDDDNDDEKTFCKQCVKKYLRDSVDYFFFKKF